MKTRNKTIFLASECLSEQGLLSLIENTISKNETEAINSHLAECEFCREAFEGLKNKNVDDLRIELVQLKKNIHYNAITKRKIHRLNWYFGAAAGILLVFGLFSIFRFNVSDLENELAFEGELLYRQLVYVSEDKLPVILDEEIVIEDYIEKFQIPVMERNPSVDLPYLRNSKPPIKLIEKNEFRPIGNSLINSKLKGKTLQEKPSQEDIIFFGEEPSGYGASFEQIDRVILNVESDVNVHQEEFIKPTFRGRDMDYFLKYLSKKLYYPVEETDISTSGVVYIRFTINETGEISNPGIIQSLHPELDVLAVKALMETNGWQPATVRNKPVKSHFTIPVRFSYFQ